MPEIIVRVGVLVLLSLLLFFLAWSGRQFVKLQSRRALAAPPDIRTGVIHHALADQSPDVRSVRILAFSSPDCKQCHQLQTPALRRVQEIHGANVSIIDIDASSTPELVHQYHVLTVPTTVILDSSGHAQAVNYGFANTQRLIEQVGAALQQPVSEALPQNVGGKV
jgi:thioredoxin-like negative regulator of GroEL